MAQGVSRRPALRSPSDLAVSSALRTPVCSGPSCVRLALPMVPVASLFLLIVPLWNVSKGSVDPVCLMSLFHFSGEAWGAGGDRPAKITFWFEAERGPEAESLASFSRAIAIALFRFVLSGLERLQLLADEPETSARVDVSVKTCFYMDFHQRERV